jgi:Flp pilus assembly protein TadG
VRALTFRRLNDDRGATAVIIALCLIAIFAMLTLTVDVGGLLYKRRELVNGADAAALAAAQSCANTKDSDNPEAIADQYAADNVKDLAGTGIANITNITAAPGCDSKSTGYVTVDYTMPQNLFFAQVLGISGSKPVRAVATAGWGPTGAGNPMPIVLNLATFQGNCDIPNIPVTDPPQTCYLWYDNDRFNGSAFGFMNLDAWNVDANASCPASGASNLDQWIQGQWTGAELGLNYPDPTYVCSTSGNRSSDWVTLATRIGDVLLFPINDQDNEIDTGSNPPSVDKYDVIGFASLKLLDVIDGNQAGGQSGSCAFTRNFPNASPLDLVTTGQLQSCLPSTWSAANGDTITNIQLKGNQPACCTLGTDYTVTTDVNGHPIVTWINNQSHGGINVTYDWNIAGPCGPPPSNSSSHCIVVGWVGATIGGGIPGGGADFGVRAVRLCDTKISGSCPS